MTKKCNIFFLGNDEILRPEMKEGLALNGYEVVEDPCDALTPSLFRNPRPDLIILGSQGGPRDELEMARRIREWDRTVPLILITNKSSEEQAVAALRIGVNDYLRHPFPLEELISSVRRHIHFSRSGLISDTKKATPDSGLGEDLQMIGDSQQMKDIIAYLLRVAPMDSNVLISGETGTGKELAAELIHRNSPRGEKPFICVNCAALPDGLLESELFGYEKGAFTGAQSSYPGKLQLGEGGTVLFDEIADMSPYAQAKILRVIESKECFRLGGKRSTPLDIRVIAATNQDLERMVSENRFRKDLYYRLSVIRIHLPPLRGRKEDIPSLIDYYVGELNHKLRREVEGFTEEALACLLHYNWPGNVRELKNLLEEIFVDLLSSRVSLMDLPDRFRKGVRNEKGAALGERELLLSILSSVNWNKSKAAMTLKWSRMTLYRKMAKYHIQYNETAKRRHRSSKDEAFSSVLSR